MGSSSAPEMNDPELLARMAVRQAASGHRLPPENMLSHARPIKLRRSLKSDRQLSLPGASDVVQSTYHDELKVRRSVSNRERRWLARAF
jgi:hypothetical protein